MRMVLFRVLQADWSAVSRQWPKPCTQSCGFVRKSNRPFCVSANPSRAAVPQALDPPVLKNTTGKSANGTPDPRAFWGPRDHGRLVLEDTARYSVSGSKCVLLRCLDKK